MYNTSVNTTITANITITTPASDFPHPNSFQNPDAAISQSPRTQSLPTIRAVRIKQPRHRKMDPILFIEVADDAARGVTASEKRRFREETKAEKLRLLEEKKEELAVSVFIKFLLF